MRPSSVLFPDPFGPTTPRTSPRSVEKETAVRIGRPPSSLARNSTVSMQASTHSAPADGELGRRWLRLRGSGRGPGQGTATQTHDARRRSQFALVSLSTEDLVRWYGHGTAR